MAVLCTELLANRARLLADMIETLPVSLAPMTSTPAARS
jgi:hypothetical protein